MVNLPQTSKLYTNRCMNACLMTFQNTCGQCEHNNRPPYPSCTGVPGLPIFHAWLDRMKFVLDYCFNHFVKEKSK